MDFPRLYMKSQSGSDQMKTLDSRSTRVQDQHVPLWIAHNLQDMGMTADKDIRAKFVYQFPCPRVISARIASDMGHQHFHALAFEETMQGMLKAQVMIITIARYSDKRLEFSNLLRQVHSSAKIPRMPDLVHRLKKFTELLTEHPVRI